MFRNRNGSQKPNEELLASFKSSYQQLVSTTRPSVAPLQGHTSLTEALDVAVQSRPVTEEHVTKDQDPTPKANAEQWRFTPSILDPNSFSFASFANQLPGYYTPTPGGINTFYHSQAGDLHTPGFSLGLETPLSLSTSEGGIHVLPSATTLTAFQPSLASVHFQNPNPFAIPHQPESYAPHQFQQHRDSFNPLEALHENPPVDEMHVDVDMHEAPQALPFPSTFEPTALTHDGPQQALENFRYHVTLNAPTAMVKQADEIPVTYLNKGQAYSISLVDTRPEHMPGLTPRYRTFIRISFEDEQQRRRPAACWQLWKEGRGTNEAHHRGGRLQAVEFVDPTQVGGGELLGRPKVELECASFDGFAVYWSPPPGAPTECSIAVRFNFLSTDFSHSKGVKGIPVRLCAKTELVNLEGPQASPDQIPPSQTITKAPEICYCKVKLFRDHGAERKLSNDVSHVKKSIEKLKGHIANLESGLKDLSKRKRSSIETKAMAGNPRPGKVPKHRRAWSISSANGDIGARESGSADDDPHQKLAALQDMFTSTRPASVLFLKGEGLDDPDMHPVQLSGTEGFELVAKPDVSTATSTDGAWERQSRHSSSMVSPTPSTRSIYSSDRRASHIASIKAPARTESNEWRDMAGPNGSVELPAHMACTNESPMKVLKRSDISDDGLRLSGWIEAVGIDSNYQPPADHMIQPSACFYVLPRMNSRSTSEPYYRAVYPMARTAKDLTHVIAAKCGIDPTSVQRALRINSKGLSILLDDDVVREIPEGIDMVADFIELTPPPSMNGLDAGGRLRIESDPVPAQNGPTDGWELRLIF